LIYGDIMSLTRKIAEGTAIYTVGNFLNNLLGFITVFFLIKALGKFEYGLLTLSLSVFAIVTIFLDLGSLTLIPSEIARYKNVNPKIAKSIIKGFSTIQILLGIAISLMIFIVGFLIKNNYSKEIINLLWIISIAVVIKAFYNILSVTFYGFTKFRLHQSMDILNSLAKCIFAFLLFYMGGGVLAAVAIYPISMIVSVGIFLPYFLKIIRSMPSNCKIRGTIWNIYREHGKFVIANVPLKRAHTEMPVWIIQYLLGVEAVAVFSVASKIVSFMLGLLMPLSKVLFPVFSEISTTNKNKMHTIVNRGIKYTTMLSIIIFIISFISMPLIFKLAFKEYYEAVYLARILLLILLFPPIFNVVTPYLYGIRGQKYIFYILLYSFFIYFFVFYIFTYIFGLTGSALGRVFDSMIIAIMQYKVIVNIDPNMRINIKEIFKIDEYDKNVCKNIYYKFKNIISIFPRDR